MDTTLQMEPEAELAVVDDVIPEVEVIDDTAKEEAMTTKARKAGTTKGGAKAGATETKQARKANKADAPVAKAPAKKRGKVAGDTLTMAGVSLW